MIALLISLFFSFDSLRACEFQSEVQSVYSLSGPASDVFKELGLLKNKKLKGISLFHPMKTQDFNGELIPGGLLIGHSTLKRFQGSLVLYDESIELKKLFDRYPLIKALPIKTRNLTPPEVLKEMEKVLGHFLKGCDWKKIHHHIDQRLLKLSQLIKNRPFVVFFLGHPQSGKWPGTVFLNDGVVKWMLNQNLIRSYPSTLSYVPWSAKIMSSLPDGHLKVGVKDSGRRYEKKMEKTSPQEVLLTFPGALTPGQGQLEAMIYLFENLFF